jgi:predicted DsbA family dithiol-disulfide isomerase
MTSVNVWSDLLCPFCYIGKRHLERALSEAGVVDVTVRWRSFQLDPAAERVSSLSNDQRLAAKYGRSVAWARQLHEEMTRRGAAAGVTFDFARVQPTNSFDAHRLAHLAATRGLGDRAQESLFRAHFSEGRRIGDPEVLTDIGVDIGLEPAEVRDLLGSQTFGGEVRRDMDEARMLGITGVPFFLLNGRLAVRGAQPVQTFVGALRNARDEEIRG